MHIFLQIVNEAADTSAVGLEETQEGLSVIDLALKGGIVIIPIAILSLIGVYILFERYFSIRKAGKTDPLLIKRVKDMVVDGNIKGAITLCETTNTPEAMMIAKGLTRIGKPLKDIHVAVQNVGNLEVYKLEKGLPILATISGAAPMIGFLGTVTGMIKTFYELSQKAETIDAGMLSGGIYEAMVTTVAGLIVGIFAFVSYNLLSAMVEKVVYKMEATSVEFLDILHEPA
jgi:biopolymer transport protein ExbB